MVSYLKQTIGRAKKPLPRFNNKKMNNDFSLPFCILPTFAEQNFPKLLAILKGKSPPVMESDLKKAHKPYEVLWQSWRSNDANSQSTNRSQADNTVLAGVISLMGTLFQEDEACTDGMMTKANQIDSLANNDKVQSIILKVRSPGGMVNGVNSMVEAIVRAKAKKPVIAFIEDGMCASAAYYIACACSHIMASKKLDLIGSIGTMCSFADFSKLYEKEGITLHEIYATKSTQKNKDYKDAIKGDYKGITAQLDQLNEQFLTTVQSFRPQTVKHQEVFTGAMFSATESIDKGLIDSIGTWQDCLNLAVQEIANTQTRQQLAQKNKQQAHSYNLPQQQMKTFSINQTFSALANFLGFTTYNQNEEGAMVLTEAEAKTFNDKMTALQNEADKWKVAAENAQAAAKSTATDADFQSRFESLEIDFATLQAKNNKLETDNKAYREQILMSNGTNTVKNSNDATALDGNKEGEFVSRIKA
jgi:protease-4